jgi:PadR family transcriptional regulator PadR
MTKPLASEFELVVMLSIVRLADEAYGLRIRDDVSVVRRRDYSSGAIYSTLQRLEEKGLVESWMTEPVPVRGGRSRRVYRATTTGRTALRQARSAASRLWAGLPTRLNPV